MLKYIQESKEENVTNSDIALIQRLVDKVKHKREVGINYMKSWEVEEMVRKEGFNDGFNDCAEKLNQLYLNLSAAGRMDDFKRALCDEEYRNLLLEQLRI